MTKFNLSLLLILSSLFTGAMASNQDVLNELSKKRTQLRSGGAGKSAEDATVAACPCECEVPARGKKPAFDGVSVSRLDEAENLETQLRCVSSRKATGLIATSLYNCDESCLR